MFLKRKRRSTLRYTMPLIEKLEDRKVFAYASEIVADLGSSSYVQDSLPAGFTTSSNLTFFTATTATTGLELWKTDGTAVGTSLVKDIFPGSKGLGPSNLTDVQGKVFFVDDDGVHGRELWVSDGTKAGTHLAVDATPALGSTFDRYGVQMVAQGDSIYFFSNKGALWKTDGTPEGTHLLKQFSTTFAGGGLTPFSGEVYFSAYDVNLGASVWKTDGTADGTTLVHDVLPESTSGSVNSIYAASDKLYFIESDHNYGQPGNTTLWVSAIGSNDAELVRQIGVTPVTNATQAAQNTFVQIGANVYFPEIDNQGQEEIWKSDGTASGTGPVTNLAPEGNRDVFGFLRVLKKEVYFVADTPLSAMQIYKLDDSALGASPVTSGGMLFQAPEVLGDQLVYRAGSVNTGFDFYASNGSAGGVTRLRDIPTGQITFGGGFAVSNGRLYSDGYDSASGVELWQSDGTPGGTFQLAELAKGDVGSKPTQLIATTDELYFKANSSNRFDWVSAFKSDGTTKGTQLISRTDYSYDAWMQNLAVVNGTVYFQRLADTGNGSSAYSLWKSDGTPNGAELVKNVFVADAANIGGTLFFVSSNVLWKSDGTEQGTVQVSDVNVPYIPGTANSLVDFGGVAFFPAYSAAGRSYGLFKSDGTAGGTVIVHSFTTPPTEITNINGKLYFSANDGVHGNELWTSDGTETGTVMVADILKSGLSSSPAAFTYHEGSVYFLGTSQGKLALYKTDGSVGNVERIAIVGSRLDTISPDYRLSMASFRGKLYFAGNDSDHGDEVWTSDGTAAGTQLLLDVAKSGGSHPSEFTVFKNDLYFAADDGVHGTELRRLYEVSQRPMIGSFGDSLTYRENSAAISIANTATITDVDSLDFNGGVLIVRIAENAHAADRLSIRNAFGVTTSGNQVLYNGISIGTWTPGVGSVALTVSFNAKASPFRAQMVLRNVMFTNLSDNPTALPRIIRAQVTDGDRSTSPVVSKVVNVVPLNDATKITVSSSPVTYRVNSAALAVMPEALLSDPDNAHFAGGKLVVRVVEASSVNRLEIGGSFRVSGDQVMLGDVSIGTVSWQGGVGEKNLAISFNSEATVARTQQLLRSIRFRTVGESTTAARTLAITLFDGSGGTSTVNKGINVSA